MQSADTILMIEPVAFGFNPETAVNNFFQVDAQNQETQEKALAEFKAFVKKLRDHGVNVIVIKDTAQPWTPDSIYPNNWVSFHKDGTAVLYPMFAKNRRLERRGDVLEKLTDEGFRITQVKDYAPYEIDGKYLEGTGALILDRDHKIAYGTESVRLNKEVFADWAKEFGFKKQLFHAFQTVDGKRLPIYHTNVMMGLGTSYVIICLDTVDDAKERENLVESFKQTGKEIIEITEDQMNRFAGNMLEVKNQTGQKFLVMSKAAHKSLTHMQIKRIEQYAKIISSDVSTIEKNGGGSVRCMMAEVFLPKA